MTGEKRRADLLLVDRGIFESRAKAQAAIAAGLVSADGARVRKASDLIRGDATFDATPAHPYVSRGGVKLAAALDAFRIDPAGLTCLDVGASTGGFTQVLLERGAAHVWAVDVGSGQLHHSLIGDSRVTSLESTDIRQAGARLPGGFDLATADVSFISLALVLPPVQRCLSERSQLVVLIKPQFEVGRTGVGRGGIVQDPELRLQAVERMRTLLTDLGFEILGVIPSPITGGDGNEEYLLGACRG